MAQNLEQLVVELDANVTGFVQKMTTARTARFLFASTKWRTIATAFFRSCTAWS